MHFAGIAFFSSLCKNVILQKNICVNVPNIIQKPNKNEVELKAMRLKINKIIHCATLLLYI